MIFLLISILLLLKLLLINSIWHAYDSKKTLDDCPKQSKQRLSPEPLTDEEIEKWKLWPGLINNFDKLNGEIVVGFREAMEAIWKNQNPEDCSKAKFLIAYGWNQGFGSEVHILGSGLALALNMKRVYVMNPEGPLKGENGAHDNTWQIDNDFCKKQNKRTLECYFEPWTHCKIEDIMDGKTIEKLKSARSTEYSEDHTYFRDSDVFQKSLYNMTSQKVILLENAADAQSAVPEAMRKFVHCTHLIEGITFYWWRAVSAAFILRPNEATRKLLKEYSSLDFNPNKERCVSIYIRHGDKHVEMKLIKTSKYLKVAKMFYDNGLIPGLPETNNSKPVIFIGSEDPIAIDETITWGKQNNWKVIYTNLFDRKSVSAYMNNTEQVAVRSSNIAKHHDLEYFSMLLNLHYHLQCEAYVCTMASNFCRVIDELKATVAGKIHRHYADLSECRNPPCLRIDKDFHLGW